VGGRSSTLDSGLEGGWGYLACVFFSFPSSKQLTFILTLFLLLTKLFRHCFLLSEWADWDNSWHVGSIIDGLGIGTVRYGIKPQEGGLFTTVPALYDILHQIRYPVPVSTTAA